MSEFECEHHIERNEYGYPDSTFIKDITIRGRDYSQYEFACSLCGYKMSGLLPKTKKGD